MIDLKEIDEMRAKILFGEKWNGEDVEISGITINSKEVKQGYVFVCICGENTDGHIFAESAVENGAVAIVAEHELDVSRPVIVYDNTKIALAEISKAFYENPQEKLKIIGITGTNGKTTTSYLIKKILENAGKTVGVIGTNEILVGDKEVGIKSSTPTTPNSLELYHIFSKMLEMGAEYVVMEVSSHALCLHRVHGITFEVGAFTNLTRDHLDYHGTMENYFNAKKMLFDISKKGIVNADDEYGKRILKNSPCDVISYGRSNASLTAENIALTADGVEFDAVYNGEKRRAKLGISGMFSVYNAMAALGTAIAAGLDLDNAISGLALSTGVCGRLERVPLDTDYAVIIDYAHTPDGLENVLNAVNSFKKGRCICVFGCGGDRDATKRPIMGEIGARLSDIAVITSDNPRTEDPEKIIEDITKGIKGGDYEVIVNRREAIKYALSIAKKDDIILLCGKGQETYQIIGKEKFHFDEREIVKELLDATT